MHGDLSEFNVLMDKDGPVIIDLPQVVDAAANNHAKSMFERDINNLAEYYGQFAPELRDSQYAKEIWALYQEGNLTPDSALSGRFSEIQKCADVGSVLEEIQAASEEHQRRIMARNAEE